jgi:hypothetical protein
MPITGGGVGGGGHVYVDRGDPSSWDYVVGDLTVDSAWHDLDLSSIVTDSDALLVHFRVQITSSSGGKVVMLRENGNTNSYNSLVCLKSSDGVPQIQDGLVSCDTSQVIEYYVTSGVAELGLSVRGWVKPG